MQLVSNIKVWAGRSLVLLLAAGLVAGTVWWAGEAAGEQATREAVARLASRSEGNSDMLRRKLQEMRHDALFLSKVPPVEGLVRARRAGGVDTQEQTSEALWEARLVRIFSAFAADRPDIVQVRLIGVADQGRELVRIEQRNGGMVRTGAELLQQKGDTDDMRAVVTLAQGQTYLSDFHLNREHGRVEVPHWATVHAATPVYDGAGKVFGAIVINYRADSLLAPLAANLPTDLRAYLVNGAGAFLLHPDASRTYGFDTGRTWRWQDQFRALAQPGDDGRVRLATDADGQRCLLVAAKIVLDPARPASDVQYWLGVPAAQVASAVARMRTTIVWAMLAGAVLVLLASHAYRVQRRKMRAYQKQLSAIVEHSRDAIIGLTADGAIIAWNGGAQAMFGYTAKEALGRGFTELIVPPPLVGEATANLRRVAAGDDITEMATRRQAAGGRELDVMITSSPMRDHDGKVTGIAKIVRDVSEQVAANRRIQELNVSLEAQVEERTRQIASVMVLQDAILAHASHAIIATNREGVIQLFNPAAERMLGYRAADLVGIMTPAILHDGAEVAARAQALTLELGEPIAPGFEVFVAKSRRCISDESEWTYVRRDGHRFPVLLSVSALRSDSGDINGYLGIASDISSAKRDRRNLEMARDQLLNAAEVAELGIFSWALASGQIDWNPRMYALYDVLPEEVGAGLTIQYWRSRIHPDDVERVTAQLLDAIDGRAKYDPVFRVLWRDGSVHHVQAAASVERDGGGVAVRVLGINRDITAQYAVEDHLRAAKQAADDASRAKSAFLANMSHEIRTPMNAVLGMLSLLKQTALAPRQLDYADKAESAGRALLGILNDILDFSRVEAGKLELDPQPFSVDRLLRDAGVILAANLAGKPIEILFHIDPLVPERLLGDAMRLQQILINIAGNAIKFTERGEVSVALRRLAPLSDDAHGVIRLGLAVRDTGIGISAPQLGTIFDGFSQAEASTARRYGGSGLGLAISRRLVALMGGELTAVSEPGRGSTFQFSVRLAAAAADTPPRQPAAPLRCLVVCQHPGMAACMQAHAALLGWQCETVDSAAGVPAAAVRACPDIVFINHQGDTAEVRAATQALRQWRASVRVMVMVAHATALPEHAAQPLDDGVDGYLLKPVTPAMLDEAAHRAILVARPPLAPRPLEGLSILLVEDNPLNQQVGSELLALAGARVTLADDGHAAIEKMQQAAGRFDCILMDVQMPGMDGHGATRLLHTLYAERCPPIIAMTANAMASDRAEALAAGMVDHVGKPFDAQQLAQVVLQHTAGRAAAPLAPPEAMPDPANGFDSVGALARFAGNDHLYRRALAGFAVEMSLLGDRIPAAASADWHAEKAALHTIKGLAGTVGATALAEAARVFEQSPPASAPAWRAQRQQLARLMARDAAFAATLAAQMQVGQAGASRVAGDPAALSPELRTLRVMLRQSNMAAIMHFDHLQQRFGAQLAGAATPLSQALDQCDFPAALRACEQLLDQLEPN